MADHRNPYAAFTNLYDLLHVLWEAIQSEDLAKARGDEENRQHHENRAASVFARLVELRPTLARSMPSHGANNGEFIEENG